MLQYSSCTVLVHLFPSLRLTRRVILGKFDGQPSPRHGLRDTLVTFSPRLIDASGLWILLQVQSTPDCATFDFRAWNHFSGMRRFVLQLKRTFNFGKFTQLVLLPPGGPPGLRGMQVLVLFFVHSYLRHVCIVPFNMEYRRRSLNATLLYNAKKRHLTSEKFNFANFLFATTWQNRMSTALYIKMECWPFLVYGLESSCSRQLGW